MYCLFLAGEMVIFSVSCHKNPPTVVRNANTDSCSLLSENNDLFVTFTVIIMLPPKHHSLVKMCVCVFLVSVLVSNFTFSILEIVIV